VKLASLAVRQVRPRSVLLVVALGALLATTLIGGAYRERKALPEATVRLRRAIDSAAAFLSCFEGVQDELFQPGVSGAPSAPALRSAQDRLSGCDVYALDRQIRAIRLPAQAPVDHAALRRTRAAVEQATGALSRAVLDARAAKRALDHGLGGRLAAAPIVLGYRSTAAGYQEASVLLVRAETFLGSAGIRGFPTGSGPLRSLQPRGRG
jgi:hypothetical protein